jgi:hypothetical protein
LLRQHPVIYQIIENDCFFILAESLLTPLKPGEKMCFWLVALRGSNEADSLPFSGRPYVCKMKHKPGYLLVLDNNSLNHK